MVLYCFKRTFIAGIEEIGSIEDKTTDSRRISFDVNKPSKNEFNDNKMSAKRKIVNMVVRIPIKVMMPIFSKK